MTAKDCRQWMTEKDYLKHGMLPQNQLFENEKGLNAYKDRPVGDSPEFMPWDTSLNRDLHCSVEKHVAYTSTLSKDDKEQFSMATPKRAAYAYIRCLQVCPRSKRIVQDTLKTLAAYQTVYDAKGAVVEGLGNREGHRKGLSQHDRRGGKRKKIILNLDQIDESIHPHARVGINDIIQKPEQKFLPP